jgi:hypothetical protein
MADQAKSYAADVGWGQTEDWPQRTSPGRQAFEASFLKMANGDPKRAAKLRQAHFKLMSRNSVKVRKALAAKRKAERLAARKKALNAIADEHDTP